MTLPSRGPLVEIPLRKPPTLDQVKAAVGGGAVEIVAGFDTIEHEGTVVRCVAFHDNGSKARNRHLLIATQQSCGMPPWYARVIRDCSSQVARSRTICAGKLPWCWETPNSWRRQDEPRLGVLEILGQRAQREVNCRIPARPRTSVEGQENSHHGKDQRHSGQHEQGVSRDAATLPRALPLVVHHPRPPKLCPTGSIEMALDWLIAAYQSALLTHERIRMSTRSIRGPLTGTRARRSLA
jgi:hypothetical protein